MKIHYWMMAVLTTIAMVGCGQNRSKDKAPHGHVHDEYLQLTAYSGEFEVYAEAKPFVVGQASDILAHFSFLKNFKPLTGGSITASLIVGTDGIRQTVEKPVRPGVYSFSLTPGTIGNGKLLFDIETPAGGKSQLVVTNIKVFEDEHEAQHAAADAVATSSNGAIFTKEQSWKLDFATDEARIEPFGQVIRTTAQILPSQGDQRIIASKASGIVTFPGQEIVEGKTAAAGQPLFFVESGEMADNNLSVRLSEATAAYNMAKAEYERKKELAADNIVSQSDLLKSETEYTNAEAVYNNLRKNFSSGKQMISSPISGYVTQVLVQNGQYVEAGQPVVVVAQNRDLLIKAELQPKFYPFLSQITTANFLISSSNVKYTLEELNGKVISYAKSSDPENPLIPVIFQVKNSVGLLSGSFIEVYIKTETNTTAITIPNESIIEEMGNYFVYAQLTPELFEKRAVRKGATDGFRTEIIDGVSAGDRIVSKGAIMVKLAQASGTLDAHSGHVH